ncbi:drug/metabolite transporter (DMT)-like permease [Nonomuraea thailandensis]|uniref:Drug/metabolite transporter (DMT)-like permease n=1 Tax=Nonomuraea thailandensis TaxID=1188745 RepID=A0A9X2K8H8_9ACTN|nr:EamA family transporter [Nonomuraea thailandensis]MCP2363685.1 drug/metabolite transporter (DMT)-like permease [Nonomuraea thailandensis]
MTARGTARDYGLYAVMTSIWGASFFFTAIALRSFNPYMIVLIRMALAAAALGIVLRVRGLAVPRDRRLLGHLALLGAFNIALPFTLLTAAQQHVTSSTAVVLSATTPVFVFLIASLVTRAERFSASRLAGIVIAFFGMAALSGGSAAGGAWPLAVVASSAIFAIGNVYTRTHLPHLDPAVIAYGQLTAATLWLVPATALTGNLSAGRPALLPVLAVVELGLLASAAGYLLYFRFILRWGSTAASVNTYLQPFVGLLLSVLVLDEAMSARQWGALAVILLGLLTFGLGPALVSRARARPR